MRLSLDVVAERQRRNVLDGAGGENLSYRIREFQRYRHAVAKNACVVVEFGECKNVLEHNVDVRLAFADVNNERIRDLTPWVGLNARRPATRPEMCAALASDMRHAPLCGSPAQLLHRHHRNRRSSLARDPRCGSDSFDLGLSKCICAGTPLFPRLFTLKNPDNEW